MKTKILTLAVLALTGVMTGCSTISHSPGVTQTSDNGDYLSVVNKTTSFGGYVVSSRNVVVRCNVKTNECATLNLWSQDGNRIF